MPKINIQSKKLFLIAALVITAIGGSVYLYTQRHPDNPPPPAGPTEKLNLDPPTEEEKQQAVDNKAKIDSDEARRQSQSNPTGKKNVKPIITYATQNGAKVEIGSYVPGIFEDDGICTADFTKGSLNVSKKVTAVREGNSTFCPSFDATSRDFSERGTWGLTVSYSSPTSNGVSEKSTIEIK